MSKIGEKIEHEGVVLECVEIDTSSKTLTCKGCYFDDEIRRCGERNSNKFACFYNARSDNKNVLFSEVNK